VPFADIDLIVQVRGSAMRWGLGEGTVVELWRGTQLLGTLTGETIRQLVAQHLSTAALVLRVREALAAPEAERPRAPTTMPPRPIPSKDMLDPRGKAARRHARRARTKKKLAAWLIAAWAAGSLALLGWDCRTDLLNAQPRPAHAVVQDLP